MIESLHDQRDINRMGLETFPLDVDNRFDYTADQAIAGLQKDNQVSRAAYNEAEKKYKALKLPEDIDNEDLLEILSDHDASHHMMDIYYRTEEMISFMEMKIIYAYKHLEINIKRLLRGAYPDVKTKDFYQWENLMTFLKSKKIQPVDLQGYQEVDQLRQVNNGVKHSGSTDPKIEKIPEFRKQKSFQYDSLARFYMRVKDAPPKFLHALTGAIYDELYAFGDARIKSLAESFVLRMDKETAEKFARVLLSYY